MQPTINVEPADERQMHTDFAQSTLPPTANEVNEHGEKPTQPQKYEYEFSNCVEGKITFIHLWDTSDYSACERLIHREVTESDIERSPTGNCFVSDQYGLRYTFHKMPIKHSYSHRDFELPQTKEETKTETKKKEVNVMDILNSI